MLGEAASVRVLLPLPGAAIDAGEKLAVIPEGSPLAFRLTLLFIDEFPLTARVNVCELPGGSARGLPEAASVKPGATGDGF